MIEDSPSRPRLHAMLVMLSSRKPESMFRAASVLGKGAVNQTGEFVLLTATADSSKLI